MADYYTHGVVDLGPTTEEEAAWLSAVVEYNDAYDPDPEVADQLPPMPDGGVLFSSIEDVGVGFEMGRDDGVSWIQDSGEWISVDHVIELLQAFLAKWRPKGEVITFAWANTCSKHRFDGFGGGAAAVAAHDYEIINTGSWQDQAAKRLKESA